ncbi:hypothetical protein C5167_018179 [Papaver somniferum]|uniref:Uncharacterized protein n=1 Tax=Papaver somniferum TaxID=3469 RepID=A0A4Y7IPM3_PAPSO|nr:hypothetical protein C5167_018179 [Papaver somniferum]
MELIFGSVVSCAPRHLSASKLAQYENNVAICKEVTPEVKQFFIAYIQKLENDKEKCEESGDQNGDEDELGTREKLMRDALKGTKTPNTLSTYFKKPERDDACKAICDFFMRMPCHLM